ncbi:uncharacterized protein F5891DRAFT_942066 [Suillus fuscotomentosus]|uniref:Fe2OG dioxygenase domain-containing protein n=1 Tax=Suillus fuscotomentosus TaxID=1912939 RepID=A0AAD4HR96_9AGAM|nr:uncharacterized protein F5891DRAFT_942066 [Suillus fuscotomentosus]KAG1906073.1 hypothetical protein F5891DRAFT_942066 [Suillus fuscotomentosus]
MVEQNILRALALGFGLEEEWFLKYHETANSQLRLHHYPSIFSELLETNKLTRISAHTDFNTLTFLFQGKIGGLEVEDPNEPGKYVPVPPIPNLIVLNAGSNDTIRSTMHRIVAPPGVAAKDGLLPSWYSMPYVNLPINGWYAQDFSTVVDSVPGTWTADYPKKYEPVSVS